MNCATCGKHDKSCPAFRPGRPQNASTRSDTQERGHAQLADRLLQAWDGGSFCCACCTNDLPTPERTAECHATLAKVLRQPTRRRCQLRRPRYSACSPNAKTWFEIHPRAQTALTISACLKNKARPTTAREHSMTAEKALSRINVLLLQTSRAESTLNAMKCGYSPL